ncbi:unnamed protein product [Heligmosomoides polygyrus]|uniref:Uncharacterized protein n=1 Tax=Heligmosomoides polygyrus TaxID=6339 RepID=A0A183FQ13_HELPZ|nr:unnamed protein product [Heligmosomoides polygyrus]
MRSDLFDRVAAPVRRMNSCDDALRGVVRNIPIRVEGTHSNNKETDSAGCGTLSGRPFQRRLSESAGSCLDAPRELRRAMSSGRLSPTEPVKPPNASQPLLASDDDDRRSIRSEVAPRRTLVIPSAIPGKTIEIPLGSVSLNSSRQDLASSKHERDRSPKPESQMEKLTQRLKNLDQLLLTSRPYRLHVPLFARGRRHAVCESKEKAPTDGCYRSMDVITVESSAANQVDDATLL